MISVIMNFILLFWYSGRHNKIIPICMINTLNKKTRSYTVEVSGKLAARNTIVGILWYGKCFTKLVSGGWIALQNLRKIPNFF